MLKAIKFRLYPTEEQAALLDRQFGCARYVYNWALDYSTWEHRSNGTVTFLKHWSALLPRLKEWMPWLLQDGNSQSLQGELRHLEAAYGRFFKKIGGYPRFKSKEAKQSFSVPQGFKLRGDSLTIPKIKGIPCVVTKDLSGYDLRSVTVSRTVTGKHFVAVLYDDGVTLPEPMEPRRSTAIGIDLGLKDFAVLSTGERIAHPKHSKAAEKRLARLQRRLAKKVKGSRNRSKAKMRVGLLHERIVDRRTDFSHKLSTRIVRESQSTICVESLNIEGMVKNRRLSKAIGASSWGSFVQMLGYKCAWAGRNLLRCGRFDPTSKVCSDCGWRKDDLRLCDREWTCEGCGTVHDRDLNAARNIVDFAFGRNYPGDTGNVKSVEREALAKDSSDAKLPSVKQKGRPRGRLGIPLL